MSPWLSAVAEDVLVVAPGILKGIGQNGHAVEGTLGVDSAGEGNDGGREPNWVKGDGAEGVAEDITE